MTRLGNKFHFKDRIPKDLTSGVVISYSVDSAMNNIMMNVCNGEHIGISPLTKKQVKPKNSYVANNLGTIQLLRLHKLSGFLTPPLPPCSHLFTF